MWRACVWDRPQKVVFKRNLDIKPVLLIWGLFAKKSTMTLAKNSKVQTGLKTNSKQDSGSWHCWVKGWFFEPYITLHWFQVTEPKKSWIILNSGSKAIIAVIESLSQNCKETSVQGDVQFPSKTILEMMDVRTLFIPYHSRLCPPNRNHNLWFLKYLVSLFMVCILHPTKTEAPWEQVPCCCCTQLFPQIL